MRHVLATYLACTPQELAFAYGATGKPSLVSPGTVGLEFNLSHSAGHALLGLARSVSIGVDIEADREVLDAEQIVTRNFAPAEAAAWLALPPEPRRAAFFAFWTAKEACAKALGAGLTLPLAHFEFALESASPMLRAVAGDCAAAAGWSVWGLQPAAGLHGAVAAAARGLELRRFRWGPSDGTDVS